MLCEWVRKEGIYEEECLGACGVCGLGMKEVMQLLEYAYNVCMKYVRLVLGCRYS